MDWISRRVTGLAPAADYLELATWDAHKCFTSSGFQYGFEKDKLSLYDVTLNEAVECFFSPECKLRPQRAWQHGKSPGARKMTDG